MASLFAVPLCHSMLGICLPCLQGPSQRVECQFCVLENEVSVQGLHGGFGCGRVHDFHPKLLSLRGIEWGISWEAGEPADYVYGSGGRYGHYCCGLSDYFPSWNRFLRRLGSRGLVTPQGEGRCHEWGSGGEGEEVEYEGNTLATQELCWEGERSREGGGKGECRKEGPIYSGLDLLSRV